MCVRPGLLGHSGSVWQGSRCWAAGERASRATGSGGLQGQSPGWWGLGPRSSEPASQSSGLPHPSFSLPCLPSAASSQSTCALPSDLSFDSSDLVMLKSLLAGLSLPSRDGRADRGLDEEGEGE